MSLAGQRIVIIGGTSGIGLAVARAAAAEGAAVVAASSSAARIEAARAALPGADLQRLDVTDEAQVAAFFEGLGRLDHLVFTAGDWGHWAAPKLAELTLDRAQQAFAVRFWGALAAVKHAHTRMGAGGSIVLTDGTVAHRPRKGAPLSTAMAGAIEHLVRGLAVDLAPLRVNGVCPGAIRTDVWNMFPEAEREERLKRMTARQPLPRIGEPQEVAEAYLHLMRAGYTTGQVLRVDGGLTLA